MAINRSAAFNSPQSIAKAAPDFRFFIGKHQIHKAQRSYSQFFRYNSIVLSERISMDEPIEIISLTGFDPEGEPEIRVMVDGSWELVFNFMPPSWAEDSARFDDFDRQLATATGMDVEWDDREVFRFPGPMADGVVDRLRGFLADYLKTID